MKKIRIGLIGNPNSGKTTLFNQLTSTHQRVGNWEGTTVEKKEGEFLTIKNKVILVDLPGIYSLTTLSSQVSFNEQITYNYIFENNPDLLINVVDASNLERHLYLTLQLLEVGIPYLVSLNMMDIAKKQSIYININSLSILLGCPVIPLVSTKAHGIDSLKLAIDHHTRNPKLQIEKLQIEHYPTALVEKTKLLAEQISHTFSLQKRRWLAIQILESNALFNHSYVKNPECKLSISLFWLRNGISDPALYIANARYHRIITICNAVSNVLRIEETSGNFTTIIDKVFLHRLFGIPIFLFIMYIMFLCVVGIGGAIQPLLDVISSLLFIYGFQELSYALHFPEGLTMLLSKGIGGGLNSILPLIPQLGIMYIFLAFLENSGYIARAVFIVDRLMRAIGLPGKSFLPLIVGFGCNVLSVLGARTLDKPQERLITIMMAPFMSCGARMAIFTVFSALLFEKNRPIAVFLLYILGIVIAILTGLMLKFSVMKDEAAPFVMELPVYRMPQIKSLLVQTTQHLKNFLLRSGKTIILLSVVLSILNNFTLSGQLANTINNSVLASISQAITPVFAPIGIQKENWQATIALFNGAMAKEVVIGTLNTLYTMEHLQQDKPYPKDFHLKDELLFVGKRILQRIKTTLGLKESIHLIEHPNMTSQIASGTLSIMSKKFGSISAAYSYLIFVLLYVPCFSVMSVIAKETNRKWMGFSIIWSLNIAYSIATIFYQIANFVENPHYSFLWILSIVFYNIIAISLLHRILKRASMKFL